MVIAFLIVDNKNKKEKIKELEKEIAENENLNLEIKKRLTELIHNNQEVEPQIANEFVQIAALLDIKQDTTAIVKLAKIIENLLKQLYKGNPEVKKVAKKYGRKSPVFADYLECAKNEKLISTEDWHLLSLMKIIRNEEAHELDIKKEKSRVFAAFISGIGLILGLCRTLKRKALPVAD
ncbi:MAG: hypothetical protein ICV66_01980 [Chitinophagaceae bacterium]|nr:hypothetical protein [Chitinophagaceae bacterium]